MSKSINTTGEFYFGVSEEKSTGVYNCFRNLCATILYLQGKVYQEGGSKPHFPCAYRSVGLSAIVHCRRAGNASFIVSFEPILIVILSISIKEERFRWLLLTGLIVSTAGLVLLIKLTNISEPELFSVFLILMSAPPWGIYTIVGKNLLRKHNPLNVTGFVSIVGTLFLIPFTVSGVISLFQVHSLYLILSLVFIGLGGTFIGYYLWLDGLKLVKPSLAGTTLYITPFVTVVVASLLISEAISVTSSIGGSLIITGLAITSLKGNK